jgi:nucleoside-diphosphate-sugar epimerase
MRILLLGGTRFFGLHILSQLTGYGHEVIVVSRKPVPVSLKITCITGERESPDVLAKINDHGPYDIVIDNIAYKPWQIEGLWAGLTRQEMIKLYVLTSSSAVYLDQYTKGMLREDDSGEDYLIKDDSILSFPEEVLPYALGKRACEEFLKQLPVSELIIRIPVVTGTSDFAYRLAYFLHRAEKGEFIVPAAGVRLQQVFSDDLGSVYLEAVNRFMNFQNKVVNVSPDSISLEEIIKIVQVETGGRQKFNLIIDKKLWNKEKKQFPYIYNQIMLTDLYNELFDYSLTPMSDILKKTIPWYLDNLPKWQSKYTII